MKKTANLYGQDEQRLKIEAQAAHLKEILAATPECEKEKRSQLEYDLKILRKQYKDILPDDVILQRLNRLHLLREKLGAVIIDNREKYAQQTGRATSKLCGVAS